MSVLICPVCRSPLTLSGGSYLCEKRHTFDRAKQGYTNLLPPKSAGQHGDSREMMLARRAFLDAGYYAPLADTIAAVARARFPVGGVFLDAGCGECYYTEKLACALSDRNPLGYGIDISREALRCAGPRTAVRDGRILLFCAGVYEMPFADNSFDLVVNVFSPEADDEYRRVLKTGGTLLLAIPNARHLFEMKEVLYDTPEPNAPKDPSLDGFRFLGATPVTSRFTLPDRESISALFSMTPYSHRTPRAGMERLASLDTLTVTADFLVLAYTRL